MLLCLDVGNTQIFGGVFDDKSLQLRFRYNSKFGATSDELGVFLKNVLHENAIDYAKIKHIAISSVVPSFDYSLSSACQKYFKVMPFFLRAGVKTGLQIKTRNPVELGADLIAGAIAAVEEFPNKNLIVVDFGTATTFAIVSAKKEYLGTVILPGVRLSMLALGENTAKLFPVEIIKAQTVIGRSTAESIQAGLYFGQLGTVKEIKKRITEEAFDGKEPIVIGTGGFVSLFEDENLFTTSAPNLVLDGLRIAYELNA